MCTCTHHTDDTHDCDTVLQEHADYGYNQIPQNRFKRDVIRQFPAKWQKSLNFHIIETTEPIRTNDKDHEEHIAHAYNESKMADGSHIEDIIF